MSKFIIIIDCQKNFIDNTPGAQEVILNIANKIKNEPADTHFLFTSDATCENGEIDYKLTKLFTNYPFIIEKNSFGSQELMECLEIMVEENDEIEFIGLQTDICVISNALMAKTHFFNKAIISCDAVCCAGSTPELHQSALKIMKSCQIIIKE